MCSAYKADQKCMHMPTVSFIGKMATLEAMTSMGG
jgi:hypothetical protein